MRAIFYRLLSILPALATASPVLAASKITQVPEGSALTLLALGVLGVIIGRRGSMRPRDSKPDSEPNGES